MVQRPSTVWSGRLNRCYWLVHPLTRASFVSRKYGSSVDNIRSWDTGIDVSFSALALRRRFWVKGLGGRTMSNRWIAFTVLCVFAAPVACSGGHGRPRTDVAPASERILAVRLTHPPCSRLCGSLEVTFWTDGHGLTKATSATGRRTECHWAGQNAAFDSIVSLIDSSRFFQLHPIYVGKQLHQRDAQLQVRTDRRTFTVRLERGPPEVPDAFRLIEAAMEKLARSSPCSRLIPNR